MFPLERVAPSNDIIDLDIDSLLQRSQAMGTQRTNSKAVAGC